MSIASGLTVSQLLPSRFDQIGETVDRELRDTDEARRIGVPGFVWKGLDTSISSAIHGALDCDVLELLAKGWCSARELRAYADTNQHPQGKPEVLALGTHQLTTSLHPVLQISVPACKFPALRFTLELSAEFRTALLTISDAHVTAVSAVECTLVAQLKYGEAGLHTPLKSRAFKPAGEFEFSAPGLAIH